MASTPYIILQVVRRYVQSDQVSSSEPHPFDLYEEADQSTITKRRVRQLLLLFKVCQVTKVCEPWEKEDLSLACVQWFQTVAGRDGFEVVEIDTIERGAHLIPCFKGLDTQMADGRSTPALDTYNEFWFNNQIDEHAYNTIYG